MEIARKTNIPSQTKRQPVVHQASSDEVIWCQECGWQMMTVQIAAILHRVSVREVHRLIERGEIHFTQTEGRIVYVCPMEPAMAKKQSSIRRF